MRVAAAAALCDLNIEQPCGGRGECAKCLVRFLEGAPPPTPAEQRQLTATQIAEGWRLACRALLTGPARIEIVETGRPPAVKSFGPPDLFAGGLDPVARVIAYEAPRPTLADQTSLLERLRAAVEPRAADPAECPRREWRASPTVLETLRAAPESLALRGEMTLLGDRLIAVGGRAPRHALAADLGSTTAAVALLDAATGAVVASASDLNPQIRYGADVISRIERAILSPEDAAGLTAAARGILATLARRLFDETGVAPESVVAAAVCGNPVMLHTLLGADARPLGMAPYVGSFVDEVEARPAELGLPMNPEGSVWIFPQVRSNVGGDAVAAALAAELDRAERPVLLIDLGTNSEILLGCREWMFAASTAAGPAFEGANIYHGMRAAPGAIDRALAGEGGSLRIRVIGGGPARGLCGSALVDAVAALLDLGAIDERGRMLDAQEFRALHGERAPALIERFTCTDKGKKAIALATGAETQDGRPVLLTELDVRALQLVKGSIRAGAETLLALAGVEPEGLEAVLLAGAFGNFLQKTSLLRIGLVPEVDARRVRFVGNAAGVGARMAAVDLDARRRAARIARRCRYVEMASREDFVEAFALAMPFPAPGDKE